MRRMNLMMAVIWRMTRKATMRTVRKRIVMMMAMIMRTTIAMMIIQTVMMQTIN